MHRVIATIALIAAAVMSGPALADPRTFEGPAVVQRDGSILIQGETLRLFGIWLPNLRRTCSSVLDPTFCAPTPVVVLFEKVRSFLFCQQVQPLNDGSIEAYCGLRARRLFDPREDLGAMMVEEGWALARPDAPAEYAALERLAESQQLGLWGAKLFNVR
jgi:hypothetical protein